ncbi:hypothetical protein CALVIDRAFT_417826 [Calocera viscosa TUFC12733]|uniref:Uncharacterized protein n=1 Tax=Calocera viscosa (strain TUFC12733) TaxID=1330018 RepID=A0A167PGW0_CALVF|nr:hypothetical protein CALVIDRAFT_417826 [Calocera viscosa TUFC12733]
MTSFIFEEHGNSSFSPKQIGGRYRKQLKTQMHDRASTTNNCARGQDRSESPNAMGNAPLGALRARQQQSETDRHPGAPPCVSDLWSPDFFRSFSCRWRGETLPDGGCAGVGPGHHHAQSCRSKHNQVVWRLTFSQVQSRHLLQPQLQSTPVP